MDADLAALLKNPVTIAHAVSRDEYNKPVYGVEQTVYCRVFKTRRLVISREALPVYSTTELYFDGDAGLTIDDKIILADGSTPVLLEVEVVEDENGRPYGTIVLT